MITFFRKIRQGLLHDRKIRKYLLYAIGEIVLVVIGILIALQINNWNNRQTEKKEEKKTYLHIRQQILDDREVLLEVRDFNTYFTKTFQRAQAIVAAKDRDKIDSLALMAIGLSQFSDFHRSGNIYETLVNSGDLKLLKNREITSAIQKLETTYNFINKLEDMHWELIISEVSDELKGVINYSNLEVICTDCLYGVNLQNIFFEVINLSKIKEAIYAQAINEIETILELISLEIPIEENA